MPVKQHFPTDIYTFGNMKIVQQSESLLWLWLIDTHTDGMTFVERFPLTLRLRGLKQLLSVLVRAQFLPFLSTCWYRSEARAPWHDGQWYPPCISISACCLCQGWKRWDDQSHAWDHHNLVWHGFRKLKCGFIIMDKQHRSISASTGMWTLS